MPRAIRTARRSAWKARSVGYNATVPVASKIILDWAVKEGYSLSETGWIRGRDRKFYFEVTAEKDGHRHITRAADRETAVVNLGMLIGYPLDE